MKQSSPTPIWKERLRSIGEGLLHSIRNFPVEACLCLTVFVLMVLTRNDINVFRHPVEAVYLFCTPLLILIFCVHRAARQSDRFRGLWTFLYVMLYFLWIPIQLWYREPTASIVVPTYIIAFILLFWGTSRQDNPTYARTILQTLLKALTAGAISAVLAGVVSAIIGSVDFLFVPGDLKEGWYLYPNAFIGIVIFPLLCCLFIWDGKPLTQGSRFLTILVDYILSPGLLIYTVILYLYILRILFQWELPEGGVAYLVGSYIGVALACRLLQDVLEKRHFDWFYKYFPAIAAAPVILLWIGIARRISEYGLTEARFFLVVLALLLTLFTGMLLSPKTRSFQLMSGILAVTLAVFSYIPGIRGRDWGIYSQKARLERLLPLLAENPKLEIEASMADGALEYLQRELPAEKFKALYGEYTPRQYIEAAQDTNPDTEDASFDKEVVYNLLVPVDLEEYTQMVPESQYHYYEDTRYGVFYQDAERNKELIRCDITTQLDDASVEKTQKLIFKNDRYMVVYQAIYDYRAATGNCHFSTGGHTLFAKP